MAETEAVGGVLDSDAGSSARVISDVWIFFGQNRTQDSEVQVVQQRYAYHGGTTNLHDHLNHVHSNEYKTKSKHCLSPYTHIID